MNRYTDINLKIPLLNFVTDTSDLNSEDEAVLKAWGASEMFSSATVRHGENQTPVSSPWVLGSLTYPISFSWKATSFLCSQIKCGWTRREMGLPVSLCQWTVEVHSLQTWRAAGLPCTSLCSGCWVWHQSSCQAECSLMWIFLCTPGVLPPDQYRHPRTSLC